MFKAYASSDSSEKKEEEKKPIVTSSTANNSNANGNTWLENKSFSIEPPIVSFPQQQQQQPQQSIITTKPKPVIDVKPKEDKKPVPTTVTKKTEANSDVFYIDRRRDRANITVQYTHGVPRYGTKFCNQRPIGSRISKPRKQRIIRYFHQKVGDNDNRPPDPFVTVDNRLEQLNIAIREQPHSFDAWKELIDYQFYLFKTDGQQEKLNALYNKQLSIIDRALEVNSNRLQYRLLRLNIRTNSHLFNHDLLLNEWLLLIKDCLKSSDDKTINETWFSYVQFILNRIEIFSIEKLNDIFIQYFSTYTYHRQTRSEKGQRFLINHMIDMLQIWTSVLQDGGYTERALGIYQTMIELHLDLTSETKIDYAKRLETIEQTWDTEKVRFGEQNENSNLREYIEKEFSVLSEEENRLFNSTYQSWLLIEQLRINFYQFKILNHSIHFHSKLVQSLNDSSQIDNEILNLTFQNSIRPFIFQLNDQRQLLQIIIYYFNFLNGLPLQLIVIQEILNKFKISLSNSLQEQLFIDNEFQQFYPLLNSEKILRTEEKFSMEYISKVYEQIIAIPSLKSYQIEFILLYWYYLAENIRELKQQNSSLYKVRLKSLQAIIKKYLCLEEYRTCLRLYTHYARIEYEYFDRITDSRRIFDLCFQTIRTNPTNFTSFDSYIDLCHWLSTFLICEFNLNHLFDKILKNLFDNSKHLSIAKQINKDKLCLSINFVLNKLFPNIEFNNIITLVINCLKSGKISKWDQTSSDDWSIYLRQNNSLCFELLFIFVNYSYLLNDPFDKIHQILRNSLLPLINEQRNKSNQLIIDNIFRFYFSILWENLFTEHLLFTECTNYLKELFESIQYPSQILLKFTSMYTCLLPLYGSYANEYEQTILSYKFNQKIEYRLITKISFLQMNLIRHLKIQKANEINQNFHSGYEHRVRNCLKQLIIEYSSYKQLWNFYELFEKSLLNNNRMKSILYDAIQNCPWNKLFYLKSISNTNNESEWKLFLNVMFKSNIHILFSLEEFDMLKELFEMKT